ncbi:TPA: DNA-directed RNA polymerase [Candidatus Falkowbacteria bacterium]|nr:DNA-directed RNA polymerase [Candidatus Falkowbacteria bacterium]HAY12698.1 DNA-directed RNA polymerase [Candidatus Falkowbacteria bacterium]HBI96648.1 DNA-directed RNA polymerase [Candidatus Falkowbacteria bacterium]HBT27136.1 DNA-directed RNA polymerase [Candidatus Falkowbacteria bacterium]HBY14389.1 DNA-directed RNA polymerase [Candidatus Falkowbacteria bacterium]
MDNKNYSGDRQMVKGNWTCSQCGAQITELPFAPDGERPLFCRDCHRQKNQDRPRRF